jgi:hypothetical protein
VNVGTIGDTEYVFGFAVAVLEFGSADYARYDSQLPVERGTFQALHGPLLLEG